LEQDQQDRRAIPFQARHAGHRQLSPWLGPRPKRAIDTPAPQDQQIELSPSFTIEQFGQDQLRDGRADSFRARRRQSIQLKATPPTNNRKSAAERRSSTRFAWAGAVL
jgi:hypothetical protein